VLVRSRSSGNFRSSSPRRNVPIEWTETQVITSEVKSVAAKTTKLMRNASPENRRFQCQPRWFPIRSPQISPGRGIGLFPPDLDVQLLPSVGGGIGITEVPVG